MLTTSYYSPTIKLSITDLVDSPRRDSIDVYTYQSLMYLCLCLPSDNIGEITLVDIKFNQVKEITEPVMDPVEDALRRSLHRAGEPE